jgi:DNA-binding transcriptional LysR family regulator
VGREKDVERLPVLGFPSESHHFPIIDRWFSDNDAAYSPVISCNNMDVLATLTASGVGVTLLPRDCYAALIEQGKLRILKASPEIPRVDLSQHTDGMHCYIR